MEFWKKSFIKGIFVTYLLISSIFVLINPSRVQAEDNRATGTISGTITCLGFISEAISQVFVDLHTDVSLPPVETIHISCNQSYQFSGVPAGTYYIGAWLDENDSAGGPPDSGEPHIWYSEAIVISSENSSYSDVDLELARYIERVSLFNGDDGLEERNWVSEDPAISGDGRYVVFQARDESYNNRGVHIFDRELNEITQFSTNAYYDGYYAPDISADGNFVAVAYRYQPSQEPAVDRLLIKEWATDPENLIVIEPWETDSVYFDAPSISGDGCRVAFEFKYYEDSLGDDVRDIYLYDCDTQVITLISVAHNGTDPGNDQSYDPAISDDGRFVAFKSRATDLIDPAPALSGNLIYVRDIKASTTELVPLPEGFSGGDFNDAPSISGDGRYITFEYNYEVFIYDREADETRMISYINGKPSLDSEDPCISADGRFVTYVTYRQDENEDWFSDIYINDLETGTLKMATKGFEGIPDLYSEYPVINEDGHFVAFHSEASDLVVDDTNDTRDVFVYMNEPSLDIIELYLPLILK